MSEPDLRAVFDSVLAVKNRWEEELLAVYDALGVYPDVGYKGVAAKVADLRAQHAALLAHRAVLRDAVQTVHDTFAKDEAAGYRSRDRQFAITILGAALASQQEIDT